MQPHRVLRMKLGWWSPEKLLAEQPRDVSLLYLGGCRARPCSCQRLPGLKGSAVPSLLLGVTLNNTTTTNCQELFTNGGETKIKNLSPIFDPTLSGLPHESSTGLILRGK